MMDFFSQVVVKAQNVCSKHERQPLNFFCKTCMVPVCRDCTVLDHKEGDHDIVDVSQALNDNADEFNNVENRSKQLLQGMKTRSDALANASKQLDIQERQLRSKIKDTFIEYRLLLERRQEGQIAILHDMVKTQKSLINARFVDVCTQGSQLQKLYDSFTKARPSNDVTKLFTVHNEMKQHDDEFAKQAEANDDELFIGCDFEITNEPMFLSEMSCVGELVQNPDMNLKNPVPAHQLIVLDMEDRRFYEAQLPDPNYCDDLMVTHVEPSTSTGRHIPLSRSERGRVTERAMERAARLRARDIIERELARDHDRDVDDTEEMEHDSSELITSSYLLRIASRLNASSANLSEAILDLSTDRDTTRSPDSETPSSTSVSTTSSSRRSGPSPPRSRRSGQNVRVVRHPQLHRVTPDRSDRYIPTRYDRPSGNSEEQ